MRKTRRFNGGDGSSVNEKGEKRYTATPDSTGELDEPTKPLPRKRIITKEQVEAKGFTNLQDFLNAERKLKRKDGKPVERAKPAAETKGGFRDISQSPRLNDMVEMQNLAGAASNRARDKNIAVVNQEQKRLADIAQRNVVPEKESAKSEDRMLKAYKEGEPAYLEANRQDARSAKALTDQGYRKGGKVAKAKTFARGGKVSSASGRGDGIAQRGKTKGRIC